MRTDFEGSTATVSEGSLINCTTENVGDKILDENLLDFSKRIFNVFVFTIFKFVYIFQTHV